MLWISRPFRECHSIPRTISFRNPLKLGNLPRIDYLHTHTLITFRVRDSSTHTSRSAPDRTRIPKIIVSPEQVASGSSSRRDPRFRFLVVVAVHSRTEDSSIFRFVSSRTFDVRYAWPTLAIPEPCRFHLTYAAKIGILLGT